VKQHEAVAGEDFGARAEKDIVVADAYVLNMPQCGRSGSIRAAIRRDRGSAAILLPLGKQYGKPRSAAESSGDWQVSGFGRIVLIGAVLAGLGAAAVRAQTVLGDPRDAAKTFAANCSACHKSPQGLAKSGQIAGFLRQHYTTGPEMSAAMAAYLVAAGSAPAASKKGATTAENAAPARIKGKKGEQLAAQPQAGQAAAIHDRTLRGKQRPTKAHEEEVAQPPAVGQPSAEETKQTATAALNVTPSAPSTEPPPIVLDLPLPPMPDAPPPELSQSVFSSSPLP
jgi:hypothetical protein